MNQFQRLEMSIGEQALQAIQNTTCLVVGIGGVGAYAAEALVRSGIGTIIIIDKDVVDITNLNRQLIALHSTIGLPKVEVMKKRLNDINPHCNIIVFHEFYNYEMNSKLNQYQIDYIIDACDTLSAKFDLINYAIDNDIKIICSMGAANKKDPTKFQITTLDKTSYDPLARILRKKCRDNRISLKIPVVYSTEQPVKPRFGLETDSEIRKVKMPPASNAFVPSTAGLICASYVINTISEDYL